MKTETNLDDVLERLGFKLISELELCDLDELICNISKLNHDNTPFIVLLEDNRHLVYESTKEFPNMIYTESMPNFTSYNVVTGDIQN